MKTEQINKALECTDFRNRNYSFTVYRKRRECRPGISTSGKWGLESRRVKPRTAVRRSSSTFDACPKLYDAAYVLGQQSHARTSTSQIIRVTRNLTGRDRLQYVFPWTKEYARSILWLTTVKRERNSPICPISTLLVSLNVVYSLLNCSTEILTDFLT